MLSKMKIEIPLFKNDRKTNPNQPDYKFSHKLASGEWLDIAAGWAKKSKGGLPFISLSISLDAYNQMKEEESQEVMKATAEPLKESFVDENGDELDSDLPF